MPYHADLDLEDLPDNELQFGAVCDHAGNRRDFTSLRAGLHTADLRYWDESVTDDDDIETKAQVDSEVVYLLNRLVRLLTMFQYVKSNRFTTIQLRTMYLGFVCDLGLREIARKEEKAPDTIRHRIEGTDGYGGLKTKAPVFYKFWTDKNKPYQRHPRNPDRRRAPCISIPPEAYKSSHTSKGGDGKGIK